jgi:hypothetical protein
MTDENEIGCGLITLRPGESIVITVQSREQNPTDVQRYPARRINIRSIIVGLVLSLAAMVAALVQIIME